MRPRAALFATAALVFAAGAAAHVRLQHPGNGSSLRWGNPDRVSIVIHSAGSDDVPDESDTAALQLAIAEWSSADGSRARLIEDTSPASRARTDWWSNQIHALFFDEDGSSGFVAPGIVAITLYEFDGDGKITDSDVLFNGRDYGFTTSGGMGRFDIQDVATHELGHLLGFDHSPWAGATMYPFVDPNVVLHRSLSEDEVHALRHAYPELSFGSITGRVQRASDGSRVRGAHVVARDAEGRTQASILSQRDGTYDLHGLAPGAYTVYAVPLGTGALFDAPVDAGNLGQGHVIETDFASTIHPSTAVVVGTETVTLAPLAVADDTGLNLGTELDAFPMRVIAGASQSFVLRGSALNPPATLLASDPDLLVTSPDFRGSQVLFQVTVPAGEQPGHIDLEVVDVFGGRSILPGALEVTPATPAVTGIAPAVGARTGGTGVTITGTGFRPGARVVIGDRIYTDGIAGTAVVGPNAITLTTAPTIVGTHDVVVVDSSGVEGRSPGAFQVLAMPRIDSVFPLAGATAGGTQVVLAGDDFQPGAIVRIGGVVQGPVTVDGPDRARFTTSAGVLGGWLLEVENPGGASGTAAFSYAGGPDPVLSGLDPARGRKRGGDTLTLTGDHFSGTTEVVFGADPDTGQGGTPAASVTFVDAQTLEVVTPQFSSKGALSVMVCEPGTGQAFAVTGAFTVKSSSGSGGACATLVPRGPVTPRAALLGAWWMLAVLLVVAERARRARVSRSTESHLFYPFSLGGNG